MVDASVPPGLMGNEDWILGGRPCGHRFQVGAGRSELCGIPQCGRDSIGTCQGLCGRRLCGMHGSTTGSFLCAACARELAARQERQRDEAERKAAAAAEREVAETTRRREALQAKLVAATTPPEIAHLVVENKGLLTEEVSRAAWIRIAESRAIEPSHDLMADGDEDISSLPPGRTTLAGDGVRLDPAECLVRVRRSPALPRLRRRPMEGDAVSVAWPREAAISRRRQLGCCPANKDVPRYYLLQVLSGLRSPPNAQPRSVVGGWPLSRIDAGDSAYADTVASIMGALV